MARSLKKGPYIDKNLLKKIQKQKQSGQRSVIKTWARDSQVSPEFIGYTFGIHNGRKFIEVLITLIIKSNTVLFIIVYVASITFFVILPWLLKVRVGANSPNR